MALRNTENERKRLPRTENDVSISLTQLRYRLNTCGRFLDEVINMSNTTLPQVNEAVISEFSQRLEGMATSIVRNNQSLAAVCQRMKELRHDQTSFGDVVTEFSSALREQIEEYILLRDRLQILIAVSPLRFFYLV